MILKTTMASMGSSTDGQKGPYWSSWSVSKDWAGPKSSSGSGSFSTPLSAHLSISKARGQPFKPLFTFGPKRSPCGSLPESGRGSGVALTPLDYLL